MMTPPPASCRPWSPSGTIYLQDNFLLGLQRYLEQHAYNTTRATDVWTALTGPLGFDVLTAMAPWTYQPGYPLVTVTVDDRRRVRLQQAPFGLQGATACDPNTAWWIPVRRAGLPGLAPDVALVFSLPRWALQTLHML